MMVPLGSSPRLRGTPSSKAGSQHATRLIPAPAGNPYRSCCARPRSTAHPRACGEPGVPHGGAPSPAGSSPRLRGTRRWPPQRARIRRLIPAPAGNPGTRLTRHIRAAAHPRACGEPARSIYSAVSTNGSSPRLRGTRFAPLGRPTKTRLIPAPAGNPVPGRQPRALRSAHPRACGEPTRTWFIPSRPLGSSPRLRGTLAAPSPEQRVRRLIPAPAGNPAGGPGHHRPEAAHPRACGEPSSCRWLLSFAYSHVKQPTVFCAPLTVPEAGRFPVPH